MTQNRNGRWTWWEVSMASFALKQELESKQEKDNKQRCVRLDVFHGFVDMKIQGRCGKYKGHH